jgi:hypothetical protein
LKNDWYVVRRFKTALSFQIIYKTLPPPSELTGSILFIPLSYIRCARPAPQIRGGKEMAGSYGAAWVASADGRVQLRRFAAWADLAVSPDASAAASGEREKTVGAIHPRFVLKQVHICTTAPGQSSPF